MRHLIALLLLLGAMTFAAPDTVLGHDEARDFNDCILINMPGTTSNAAARAIEAACRSKYPGPNQAPGSRSDRSQEKLWVISGGRVRSITLSPDYKTRDVGHALRHELFVHNGLRDWHLRELRIQIKGARLRADKFVVAVDIPPNQGARVVLDTPRYNTDRARIEIDRARALKAR